MSEKTIFEACVAAVEAVPVNGDGTDPVAATLAVLRAISDMTASPATIDELMRIARGGGVEIYPDEDATEAKADPAPANALCGEATGSYQPGFYDRLQVLQMCGGNATMAELAWAWLNKSDAP